MGRGRPGACKSGTRAAPTFQAALLTRDARVIGRPDGAPNIRAPPMSSFCLAGLLRRNERAGPGPGGPGPSRGVRPAKRLQLYSAQREAGTIGGFVLRIVPVGAPAVSRQALGDASLTGVAGCPGAGPCFDPRPRKQDPRGRPLDVKMTSLGPGAGLGHPQDESARSAAMTLPLYSGSWKGSVCFFFITCI